MFDKLKSSVKLTSLKRKQGARHDCLSHKKPASERNLQIHPARCGAALQRPGIAERRNCPGLKQKNSPRNLQTSQHYTLELLTGAGAQAPKPSLNSTKGT
jgi:hypothetical protein